MITADQVERSIDWLRDNAEPAAKARAERAYMEIWIKSVLSLEMKKHASESGIVQEREARCSEGFITALNGLREAVYADERHRFLRAAAEAKVEAWRSFEATRRAEGKAYT